MVLDGGVQRRGWEKCLRGFSSAAGQEPSRKELSEPEALRSVVYDELSLRVVSSESILQDHALIVLCSSIRILQEIDDPQSFEF